MKTNKSYSKRLKQTPTGKLIARIPGRGHYNAKESGSETMRKKRSVTFTMSNKNKGRYLGK